MPVIRDIAYAIAGLASSPIWGTKLLRTGKWRTDWASRFGKCELHPVDRPTILIHAVSVGEVNATRKLVEMLQAKHNEAIRIVISATTDTGIARAQSLYEDKCEVVRYPLDFTPSVRRFFNSVQPDVVCLMELELWPTFVGECVKRHVPVAVINGRLSERSFATYRKFRWALRRMFASLSAAAVQDEAYAKRFYHMGVSADRVQVSGTMKWDTAVIRNEMPGADEMADEMGIDRSRPLIVFGCTGPGEEAMAMKHLCSITDGNGRDAQLMIVPRKPERFDEAAEAMGNCVRRTQSSRGLSPTTTQAASRRPQTADLFLLDTIGELGKAYSLADAVVVGRSFCPLFGSDMIEPIALGKPVVIGPNTSDFADTMNHLLAGDGIIQVKDMLAAREAVTELLKTNRGEQLASNGRKVILQQQGATLRHVELIERLLFVQD